jgi:hypothetical protein
MRFLLLATTILVGTTMTLPAFAGDSASAEALYRSAKDAAKKKDWATACAQFAESHRLDPAPGTLINLADCEEKRGLVASAWTHFVEVEKKFKPGDSRVKFAHDHAAALEKRIPKITVKLEPGTPADTTKVYRDDVELGAASLGVALPVDPGAHVIKTANANGEEKKFPITVSEGTSTDVVVSAVPVPVAAPTPAPTPTPAPAPVTPEKKPEPAVVVIEPEKAGNKTLGYALLGGGAIGIAIGAVSGVVALSKASEVKDTCGPDYLTCNQSSVDAASTGKTMTTVSTVGFIVGGVLAAAGVYFAFIAPDPKKPTTNTATRAWFDGSVRGTF